MPLTWSSVEWRDGAVAWLDAQLAGRGIQRRGDVEQPHPRPWRDRAPCPDDRGHRLVEGHRTGNGVRGRPVRAADQVAPGPRADADRLGCHARLDRPARQGHLADGIVSLAPIWPGRSRRRSCATGSCSGVGVARRLPAARLAPPAGELAVRDDHGGWKARCYRRGGVGSGDVDDLAGLLVADHVLVEGLEQMDGA